MEDRLHWSATHLGVSPQNVVSMKLRPVGEGTYVDIYGRKEANCYLYSSEYQEGRSACHLVPVNADMNTRRIFAGHPSDPNEFIFEGNFQVSRLRPECLHLVSRFVRPEQE